MSYISKLQHIPMFEDYDSDKKSLEKLSSKSLTVTEEMIDIALKMINWASQGGKYEIKNTSSYNEFYLVFKLINGDNTIKIKKLPSKKFKVSFGGITSSPISYERDTFKDAVFAIVDSLA